MMVQWEGPLYLHVEGNPPVFEARGLSGFCGLDVYSPEQDKAEWLGDDIGLMWGINYTPGCAEELSASTSQPRMSVGEN